MAQYQISVDSEKVKDLMIRDDGHKGLVEEVLNQILEDRPLRPSVQSDTNAVKADRDIETDIESEN